MVNIQLIEQLRKEHGYNQEDFSKMLGYKTRTAYNKKIKGVNDFSINDIVTICKIFSLELSDLIQL